MKAKTLLTAALLLFVAASLAWMVLGGRRDGGGGSAGPAAGLGSELTVYYFHGSVRCPNCNLIEMLSRQALEAGFREDLAAGRTAFLAVNTDEPANAHFVRDYQLAAKSVVLVETRGGTPGRWKNLERVWQLFGDDAVFVKYVQDEIRAFRAAEKR